MTYRGSEWRILLRTALCFAQLSQLPNTPNQVNIGILISQSYTPISAQRSHFIVVRLFFKNLIYCNFKDSDIQRIYAFHRYIDNNGLSEQFPERKCSPSNHQKMQFLQMEELSSNVKSF